ncbi:diguanylate cyclase, partial [Thermogutta sp.]|uniref:diguanylate cyclase n=1 Tax=Thermogutta sp. TaxID=1962930 RepID=UPI0025CCA2D9
VLEPEGLMSPRPTVAPEQRPSGHTENIPNVEPSGVKTPIHVRNVIIADDDDLIRKMLARWLTRAGYNVREATNGTEALRIVREQPPDIVITDWEMPGVEGPQLCHEIRQLPLPHYVYLLILTSRNDPKWVVEGLESGADDFLSKPIREAELVARLRAAARILEGERKLQQLARTDALTGLLSQRSFYDILCYEFQRARRTNRPLSCAMLDLDFFKRINDVYGHPVGDVVLKVTADTLLRSCRHSDVAARYGGEEFCVLLPEISEAQALKWAERFREMLRATEIVAGDKKLTVTCSVGVSGLYEDTLTPEQLLDQADQALLCAKRTGRDRVVTYQTVNQNVEFDLDESHRRHDLFEGILAEHVMTPIVAPLQGDETVEHVAAYFLRSRISSAPVVNENGQLIGIVSEKDLMEAITSSEGWNRPISELMRPHVITYPADTPVRVIYEFLCRVAMRRVIITDQGVPVGIVSRASLLRWFRNLVLSERARAKGQQLAADNTAEDIIQDALNQIGRERDKMAQKLVEKPPDLCAHLVGAASRIQEIAVDILAFASAVQNPLGEQFGCGASSVVD